MDDYVNHEKQSGHEHEHGRQHHMHSEEEKRIIINRLSRAIGHLNKVKWMVEQDLDCCETLIQLVAVRNAINNTGKEILKRHLNHCIVEAVKEENMEALDMFNKAIGSFIK